MGRLDVFLGMEYDAFVTSLCGDAMATKNIPVGTQPIVQQSGLPLLVKACAHYTR